MLRIRRSKTPVDHLRALSLFKDIADEQLMQIDGLVTWLRVPTGRQLTTEGAAGRECMIVVRGEAVASRAGSELGEIGPGELIGEMALLNRGSRTASVIARTPMELLLLNLGEFQEMLRIAPAVRAKAEAMARERAREQGGSTHVAARRERAPRSSDGTASWPVVAKGGGHAHESLA